MMICADIDNMMWSPAAADKASQAYKESVETSTAK